VIKMGLKSKIAALMIAGSALASGCIYNKEMPAREGIYPSARIGGGVELTGYILELGKNIQTTPMHPDDGGPSAGGAITNLEDGFGLAFRTDLEGSVGTDYLRIKAAAGARVGIPGGYESYAFTQLNHDFAFIPSVGLKAKVSKNVFLSVDANFPYSGFTATSGHDRYGQWQTVQRDHWQGWGFGVAGTVEARIEENWTGSVSLGWEEYKPEFGGEKAKIDAIIVKFMAGGDF
jgi:hypothetical protein